jgi:hypothetical protein
LHDLVVLVRGHQIAGVLVELGLEGLGFLLELVVEPAAALLGADAVDGAVAGHGGHPREGLALGGFVEVGFLPDLHENLLHDVLSVLMVVQDAVDGGVQEAVELAMERLECRDVAASDGLEHLRVGGQFGSQVSLIFRGDRTGRCPTAFWGESHRFHIGNRHPTGRFV